METIYLKNTVHVRPRDNVVELQAWREQRSLLVEGAALPEPSPLVEVTPELRETEPTPLSRFTAWADAAASAALAVGAVLVLLTLL
jgi:hypothetical protein